MQDLTLEQIERAIKKSGPEKQRRLLARLPKLIGFKSEDLTLMRLAEPSFEFWNNDEDSVYDRL